MLENKTKDMTPFDMKVPPKKQNPYLLPLIWGGSYLMTRRFHLKIKKKDMKTVKSPYLVLSTHQGFADYYIAPLTLFPHRANYVSDMEGFAAFGKWLYQNIGCIGKRRYVPDYTAMKNIHYCLFTLKQPVVLFPESRHSNAGITSLLPKNLGRLVKHLGVPLAILSAHGSYLANPFWDEAHTRKVPLEAVLELIYTAEQINTLSAEEIQACIEKKLQYNEYQWQLENKIQISHPKRAEGLHKALYQCISCGSEYGMESNGCRLSCTHCGKSWKMDLYGQLLSREGKAFSIPAWYQWQREQTAIQMKDDSYRLELSVHIEALPNEKGFVDIGTGKLQFCKAGFTLFMQNRALSFHRENMESLQTEYDYRGNGSCIVLSTKDCCYYLYSQDPKFCVTKLQFAVEY